MVIRLCGDLRSTWGKELQFSPGAPYTELSPLGLAAEVDSDWTGCHIALCIMMNLPAHPLVCCALRRAEDSRVDRVTSAVALRPASGRGARPVHLERPRLRPRQRVLRRIASPKGKAGQAKGARVRARRINRGVLPCWLGQCSILFKGPPHPSGRTAARPSSTLPAQQLTRGSGFNSLDLKPE